MKLNYLLERNGLNINWLAKTLNLPYDQVKVWPLQDNYPQDAANLVVAISELMDSMLEVSDASAAELVSQGQLKDIMIFPRFFNERDFHYHHPELSELPLTFYATLIDKMSLSLDKHGLHYLVIDYDHDGYMEWLDGDETESSLDNYLVWSHQKSMN